jgi:hypothetical protein
MLATTPIYFDPETGNLELYRPDEAGKDRLIRTDENDRIWIPEMQLFLGSWKGMRENRHGYWLRWWDDRGNLLPWGAELVDCLAAQLRAAGIEPDL